MGSALPLFRGTHLVIHESVPQQHVVYLVVLELSLQRFYSDTLCIWWSLGMLQLSLQRFYSDSLYIWWSLGMLQLSLHKFYRDMLFISCSLIWGHTFGFWYTPRHISLSEKQMMSRKKLGLVPPSTSFIVVILGLPSQDLHVNNHYNGCALSSHEPLESISSFLPLFSNFLPHTHLNHKLNYFFYHYPLPQEPINTSLRCIFKT